MSIFIIAFTPVSIFLSGLPFILDFFLPFLCFMSILPVPYFSLASEWFWTFLLFFLALCPFSPARFRISLWLPDDFGLFYCFSRPYVHFLLPGSVFLSNFRRILDFFTVFLGFMSIFSCPVPYFPLASEWFWTFSLFFSLLCPYGRVQKSPDCDEFRSLKTAKSTETSRLRKARKSQNCDEFRSLQPA